MRALRLLLRLSPSEASFAARGFHRCDGDIQERLEHIGRVFLEGYDAALKHSVAADIASEIDGVSPEFRGFAFEGAAMALTLLDHLLPGPKRRLRAWQEGPGNAHVYMTYIGAGWAVARLPWLRWRPGTTIAALDPVLRWLVLDGYGFHEGYFHWQRCIERQAIPHGISGYFRRAFDQGLGRSLWFVEGANPCRVSTRIAAFARSRQADLWAGIGIACAYAGGTNQQGLEALRTAAGSSQAHLAQGTAFAAGARHRASIPAQPTELACQVLWHWSAGSVAEIVDRCRHSLLADGAEPAYEVWRGLIRESWAQRRRQNELFL